MDRWKQPCPIYLSTLQKHQQYSNCFLFFKILLTVGACVQCVHAPMHYAVYESHTCPVSTLSHHQCRFHGVCPPLHVLGASTRRGNGDTKTHTYSIHTSSLSVVLRNHRLKHYIPQPALLLWWWWCRCCCRSPITSWGQLTSCCSAQHSCGHKPPQDCK